MVCIVRVLCSCVVVVCCVCVFGCLVVHCVCLWINTYIYIYLYIYFVHIFLSICISISFNIEIKNYSFSSYTIISRNVCAVVMYACMYVGMCGLSNADCMACLVYVLLHVWANCNELTHRFRECERVGIETVFLVGDLEHVGRARTELQSLPEQWAPAVALVHQEPPWRHLPRWQIVSHAKVSRRWVACAVNVDLATL